MRESTLNKTFEPRLWSLILLLTLTGCSTVPWSGSLDVPADSYAENLSWTDDRGRFREVFCEVNRVHGVELPEHQPCEDALTRIDPEPPGTGSPVGLEEGNPGLIGLLIPGVAWQCVREWMNLDHAGPRHVSNYNFELRLVDVGGLSSSSQNAVIVRDALLDLQQEDDPRPVIIIGYSKGAVDALEALVAYPEAAMDVAAMVSYAGAIGGTALALETKQSTLNLLQYLPGSDCEEGDSGALESLRPQVRRGWLAENPLPEHIDYYSVASFPNPERISRGLKSSWRKLAKLSDPRNDSQVVFYDQIIPGSTLLALANADHWAMGVPVSRHTVLAARTFANQNDYPREVMLEALMRYVEERLQSTASDPAAQEISLMSD